jgi:hypothetical protein
MNNKELITKLNRFVNKAWCTYTEQEAGSLWRELSSLISQPYNQKISTEWGHVQLGYGIEQARLALKDEVDNFIRTIQ